MQVFTYWSGPVSWLERLSARTAKATGHDLTVFSYEPDELRNEGLSARIEDGREVFCDPSIDHLRRKFPSHFSNQFRLEGLAKGIGIWCDLDLVYLRQIGSEPVLFGWESESTICNAVLRLPADCALLQDYLALIRRRPVPYSMPWWTRRQHIRFALKRLERFVTGRSPPRFQYGPLALTHLAKQHGLDAIAAEQDVFYPLPPTKSAVSRFCDAGGVEGYITPRTRTVHSPSAAARTTGAV
jgi:hypothetical protein